MLLALAAPAIAQTEPAKPKSDLDKVGDTAEGIVEKPLKDLNLMKDPIPPQLQAIMDRPYDLHGMKTCKQYSTAIGKLTAQLGPDVDSPEARAKKGQSPAEFALGAGASVIGGLIPGAGLIRKVSGAEAAQKKAAAAVLAGSLRRAYIKGKASAQGCKI